MGPNLSFDSQGFSFLLKLGALVGVLAIVAHVSGSIVGRYAYGTPEVETDAIQEPFLAHALERLKGALEVNTSQAVADEMQQPRTVADFVPTEGRFIGIDLAAQKLMRYEDGNLAATYDIDAYSEAGGPDRVPAGLFTVEAKEELGYSEVDKQYLPYRLRFNDRYSVYGRDDEEEGSSTSLVAGVRLRPDDAADLYASIEPGDQLYVLADAHVRPAALATLDVLSKTMPAVSARSFILRDAITGDTYLEKNAELRYPIASITKLTTALVASEIIGINEEVTVRGRKYVVGELYYPLFLASDNGVAESLASHVGTGKFIARMNTKARALGMYDTNFADSSGLSPRNVSTAADLASLGRYLYHSKRGLLDISNADNMTITASDGSDWPLRNQNKLALDPHFIGGKLGFTDEARQTSLGVFSLAVNGQTRVLCVVILGSNDWKQDTRTLLTWFSENVDASESAEGAE